MAAMAALEQPGLRKVKSTKKRKAAEPLEEPSTKAAHIPSTKEEIEPPLPKKHKTSVPEIEVDVNAPEPPSKRALRQLRKAKPPPRPQSGAEPSPSAPAGKLRGENRSERGIWIGNLPWSCAKKDLRIFLVANSDIADEAITRIHMPGPSDKKPRDKADDAKPWKKQCNKGFAYVDLATPEDVVKALKLSEQPFCGRRVLIKDNKSFEGRPLEPKETCRNDGKPPNRRVFLGNLRFDTTKESLIEHFGCCGSIEDVMVATFEDSGKCKGYAWITFAELEAAQAAVRGHILMRDAREEGEEPSASDPLSEKGITARTAGRPLATPKKRFVDRINKRPVRREFAEDAQARYSKRFGKDAKKPDVKSAPATDAAATGDEEEGP
jgi:RNA recognition motif-containing protein